MTEPEHKIVELFPVTEKLCTKCGEVRPLTDFWNKADENRRFSSCKSCEKQRRSHPSSFTKRKQWEEKIKAEKKIVPETIICRKCGIEKNNSEFHKKALSPNGKNTCCKDCAKDTATAWKQKYYSDPVIKEKVKKRQRENHLKSLYGVTQEMFNAIFTDQDGKCAICFVTLDSSCKSLKPNMDHCHVTNKARGILCHACNTSLGAFGDSEERLRSAINYLSKHRSK